MSAQAELKTNRRTLWARWRRLPIQLKLLAPAVVITIIAVALFALFVAPTVNRFVDQSVQIAFDAQAERINARVREMFEQQRFLMLGFARSPEVHHYYQAQAGMAPLDPEAQVAVETLIANSLFTPGVPLADLRLLDQSGDQLMRAYNVNPDVSQPGVIVPLQALGTERDQPYIPLIRALQPGQIYVSPPSLAQPIGSSARQIVPRTDLEFQIGTAIYLQNQYVGMVVAGIRPAKFFSSILQPDPAALFQFRTVLVGQDNKPIAVAGAERRPAVSVLGDTMFILPSQPDFTTISTDAIDTISATQYKGYLLGEQASEGVVNGGLRLIVSKSTADTGATLLNEVRSITIGQSLTILFGILLLALFIDRVILRPINRISQTAQRIAHGERQVRVKVTSEDEVGRLGHALNNLNERVSNLIETLEARVRARTRNIEIAADIARRASQVRDIDLLLQQTVDAIRERFKVYHAQVFLLDDAGQYAVLHTSTGDAGRELLARKHRLGVGSPSIVGQVTFRRRTFITLDTEQSEVPHRFNPLLPLTRSEMALPLIAGNRLIGALDIQSTEPDAFKEDDIQIFQILADQLAIAIDNAQLIAQEQERAEQIDRLNRQLTRQSWQDYVEGTGEQALNYRYDMLKIIAEPPSTGDNGDHHGGNGGGGADGGSPARRDVATAPLAIRGETIGELTVSDELGLSRDEKAIVQAVAERVSLAIENIRLVEQSQTALTRVEQLYESTRALSSAPDVKGIYQVIAGRLSAYDFVDRVVVLLAGPEPVDDAAYYEYAYTWERTVSSGNPFQQVGRLPREAIPPSWRVSRMQRKPVLADMVNDLAELPASRRAFAALGVRSLAIAPLATADRTFGGLLIQSTRPNAFSPNFVQFAGALGEQLSIAIENRYLYDAAQAEAMRNRALAEASQIASQIGVDFETGVTNLIRTVAPSAEYDRWWFGQIILTPGGIILRRVTSEFEEGSPLAALDTITLETHRSALAEATRTNRAIIVNDPLKHHTLQGSDSPDNIRSYGKHIAVPVRVGSTNAGILMVGRPLTGPDMTTRDLQLANALASQIAVVLENQRLFNIAQRERETLQSVIDSLPTAVVVVDAGTRQYSLTNQQARILLGLDALEPSRLFRTGLNMEYDPNDVPAFRALGQTEPIFSEDVTVVTADGEQYDTLVNAVPILKDGEVTSSVAVFQDVTELRELENVLQESLRETTTLYEISRAIAAENDLVSILRVLAQQVHSMFTPAYLFLIFADARGEPMQTYRAELNRDDGLSIILDEEVCPIPRVLLRSDETYVDSNITENPDLMDDPQLKAFGMVSVGVFPLTVRSRTVGWMFIGFQDMRQFSPEERRTLGNMADQTAVAAESARLADQTAQALSTTTLLYEASLNISRAESVEATLDVIREQLMYFEPSVIDIFLVSEQRGSSSAAWVVHWDQFDMESTGAVQLLDAPHFDAEEFIAAGPMFIDTVAAAPEEIQEMLRVLPGKFAAHASLPMLVKGRIAGRISVGFSNPTRFGRAEQQIFSTLADQGAIAIDNFTLVEQTQESLDETATLYQTSRAISNATDLHEELNAIIDYAVQAIINGALVFRLSGTSWDAQDASVEIVASWHKSNPASELVGARYVPDTFPAWSEISSPQMLWYEDLGMLPNNRTTGDTFYRELGFRSVLIFPLMAGGLPVGALMFGSDVRWPMTDREMRVYTSLADLLAISMERQRLLEQTERRARQLQLSAQIAQAAASILNLTELFDRTVNLIKENFDYDHVQVFRISSDGTDAKVVASTGEAGRRLLAIGHHLEVGSRSVIGQVTQTGMPQIIADITDKRSVHKPNPFLPDTRSEMAIPLIARSRILGALDVQSNQPGAFTREDVAVLSTLADQVAIAIDNAELFELSNQRVEEMRFLFDTTRTATEMTGFDRETVVNLARMILENIDAEAVSLLAVDELSNHLIPYSASKPGIAVTLAPFYDMNMPFFTSFAEEGEPIVVNDVPAMLQIVQTTQRLGQSRLLQQFQGLLPNAGSLILLPMRSGDNFLGMIAAARRERHGFSDDVLRLLQTLSSSLSAILQNVRLLRAVQQANVRLMELDKVKNQFLANMSHELRTPLNSIIGFSRVILKGIDGPLTETQQQDLTTIYDSGKHLLGLVNDILDQAKIEADKMEFTVTNFSMVDLIRGVMSTAVGLVKDKPVRLHQEIDPNLPHVWGDEFRTRQALLNLVSNAAKFTPQGNLTVSAFPIEEDGQPFVQVSVTDTGIGIPPDKLEAIFHPFQQAENSAARQYEGTGLGLPIARKLIEKQGGRIWVTSEPGIGSTFSFTMPINKPETEEEEQAVEA